LCGIFGVAGKFKNTDALKVFTDLAELNRDRGQLGYGLLVGNLDNTGMITKGPGDMDFSKIFDEGSASRGQTRFSVDNTIALLGHTRAPTGGTPTDTINCHPFSHELAGIDLAHNGILIDHEQLRALHPTVPEDVKTDSIALLYAIADEYMARRDLNLSAAIRSTCTRVRGSFACWIWERPLKSVYVFRSISPIHYRIDSQMFAFSSTPFEDSKELDEGRVLEYNAYLCHLYDRGKFVNYTYYA
jgi:glutamine phosphoribosylpyrophosphate amidotransferase